MKTIVHVILLVCSLSLAHAQEYDFRRLDNNPIISGESLEGNEGANINGPSLIKVPEWLPNKLGHYYLYFAHHEGQYIRLAYADDLQKSWKVYDKGTLRLSDSDISEGHVASPDVLVDHLNKEIVMYFHSPVGNDLREQYSFRAVSKDGITFKVDTTILGASYFRVFQWKDTYYAIARTGQLYRSSDGGRTFESGPNPFSKRQTRSNYLRHAAVKVDGDNLLVFYSNIGDRPEHVLLSVIRLNGDWSTWAPSEPITIVKPEMDYEGADKPLIASEIGSVFERVHQLRDPAFYEEEGRWYLIYSTAGESGLAIGELIKK